MAGDYATYTVTMTWQHPAWNERGGATYTVTARTKAEAIKRARRIAEDDGHVGRRYFKAVPATDN